MVQRVRLCTPGAGGSGSIPGRGTKIPHVMWCVQKQNKTTATTQVGSQRGGKKGEGEGPGGFSVALYLGIEIMKAQGVTQTL